MNIEQRIARLENKVSNKRRMKNSIERKISILENKLGLNSKKLRETGEMSHEDLFDEDGEFYEWGQQLLSLGKDLQRLSKNKIKIGKLHPFDKYSGPYIDARINNKREKIWSGQDEWSLSLEYLGIEGSPKDIINQLYPTQLSLFK